MISCDINPAGPEFTSCSPTSVFLPSEITREIFSSNADGIETPSGSPKVDSSMSISMDNSLSPAHTLVQIVCQYHKGLLYDVMRTLKDYNIKVTCLYNPIRVKIFIHEIIISE